MATCEEAGAECILDLGGFMTTSPVGERLREAVLFSFTESAELDMLSLSLWATEASKLNNVGEINALQPQN